LVCIAGGILIVPRNARTMHVTYYGAAQNDAGNVTVEIDAVPEPKLHVIGMTGADWVKECLDEHGNSLVQQSVNRRMLIPRMIAARGPRLVWWPLIFSFREFPGMGDKIARLKGEL